jgi:excisionase family DNA binding protein
MVYVDNREIAKTFQIPVSTVDYLRRQGKVPCFKVGKHYRFDIKEVERVLRGRSSD